MLETKNMKKNSEYEKMPKTFSKLDLSEKELSDVNKLKWVVTEKIHGANFSLVYEDRKLLFAKRKDYLSWDADFFGFQQVVNEIEDHVLQLFEALILELKADKLIIYGELFGGKYPHPDVPADPDVEAIQTGIYYAPAVHFCAFDIAFEIDGKKAYLDYDKAVAYFDKYGILFAKPLLIGKINEVQNFNIRINSSIPAQLGLPELEQNLIEGVVIKPLNHSHLNLNSRPVVKLKNPEFDEEKKFHESEAWSFKKKVVSKSEELSFILEEIATYINENRVQSAVSKTGKIDLENEMRMQEIQEEVLNDTWIDFNENNNSLLSELEPGQQEWLRKRMYAQIRELLNGQ
jgi:Rnl2 family RNA ligase